MARTDPPDYGANDPTGYAAEPESEPIPRWRKPWALVGVGVLIAVLIGVIIYGLILLSGEDSTPTPATEPQHDDHNHDSDHHADYHHDDGQRHANHDHDDQLNRRVSAPPPVGDHVAEDSDHSADATLTRPTRTDAR